MYCILPVAKDQPLPDNLKGPIQPKYFYDYVSAVHRKVYWALSLSLTKISYSNPQISSTYCMTLEGFDGPILSQFADMNTHVCTARGKCVVTLPINI